MENRYLQSLVQIILENIPKNADKSLLFAFCNGVVTTYDYFYYEFSRAVELGSLELPSDKVMDNIQGVRDSDEAEWTAFVLAVKKDSSYEIDFYDDLNPTLECSSALRWLEYAHYNIEPASDFDKSLLQSAIKAEKFKKTLNYACYKKDISAIKEQLINIKQSKLNKKDPNRKTPLHIACLDGDAEIVKLLVGAGADLKIKYQGDTPFALACSKGDAETVKYLISKGEDVNEVMARKVTPLHLISQSGNKEIVEYVLDRVININAVTSMKYSALHYAVESNNLEGVTALIENGIDMELLENYKRSALALACDRNQSEMAELLLERGANINSIGLDKKTPLHLACERGFIEVVKILIKYDPDLHARATLYSRPNNEKLRETPIETAKRLGYSEIANILGTDTY
ncbi:ankyrin repeat domain-containing protein [Metabacillus fastidiosus]|uniref:Ankyrin repeat domain-containing protein n=1 Tax=Metabacillus fastidiosus TaxID=1458 RepID=A0ABU6NXP2_9BACI|nr:ankyrin repeat domain-containing protein [Metabacillus fastidiosus]MED4401398.1 ankyrin repeat domain-containing protein [Metabacillus fastidiosus]